LTPHEAITHYNNYYEFGTEKDDPARAGRLRTRPWSVVVDGECSTGRIDLDDLSSPRCWKSASTAIVRRGLEHGRSCGLSAGRCACDSGQRQGEIRAFYTLLD
jgi:hypothetical protein